jgi:hypothetical protein
VTVVFGAEGLTFWLSDREGHLLGEWSDPYSGGLGTTTGGVGNQEPLALGAATSVSGDRVTTPISNPFAGRLDDFRLYSLER